MSSVRGVLAAVCRGLSGVSVGHRIAGAKTMEDEFELIAVVFAQHLLLAFITILLLSAIAWHDPAQRLLSVTNAALPLACANIVAFVSTYLASSNWIRSDEVKKTVRSRWLLISASVGWSLFSLGLTVGLFFVFDFGTVLGSVAANIIMLHCLFALRTGLAA
jgi:hypothetical protein